MKGFQAASAVGLLRAARTVYLAVGGVLALVYGGWLLGQENPAGVVVLVAAAGILVFLPRRFFPVFACLVLAGDGLLEQQPVELVVALFGGLLAGVGVAPAARLASNPQPVDDGDSEPEEPKRLVIRSLGTLVLKEGDQDHAGAFLRRESHSFLWLYLLAYGVAEPGKPVLRPHLAHALNPLLQTSDQLRSLSNRVSDLRKVPAALKDCFRQDGDLFQIDLTECDFDVERLLRLRERVRSSAPLSDTALVATERALADIGWGEFLPMWEEVDHRQTKGRGEATEVVERARMKVAETRADVALAIADAHLVRQQPAAALRMLEPAAEASPDREDVLQRLELAYIKTDQRRKAEETRTGNLQAGVK